MTTGAAVISPTPDNITPNFIPPTIGEPAPVADAPIEKTPEQLRLEALEAQNAQIMQQNQQLVSSLNLMMQRPVQQVQQAQPQAMPEFNLDGLADPVAAPKDFMTGLQNRIRQREGQMAQTITSAITTQVSRGAALDSLYNGFRHQHSELAKKQGLLQGATTLEFQRLQQQGIDPALVAMQNPDSLIAAIAQRMHAELGTQPGTVTPGAQPNPQPQNGANYPQTLGAPLSAARVAGIQGGTQNVQRGAPAPVTPPGFTDQIKAQQKKMGLY